MKSSKKISNNQIESYLKFNETIRSLTTLTDCRINIKIMTKYDKN